MNKLTLVLTSYNRQSFLKEMIESLQNQSDLFFNLIICDNHSTDGSWLYIDDLEIFNKGTYVKLHWEVNKGWAGSAEKWNKYIQTEWVSILCDDDWLGIDYVKTLNSAINNHSNLFSGLIITGHKRINLEKHKEKEYSYSSKTLDIENATYEFYNQNFDVAGISGFALQTSILKKDFPKYYEGNGFLEDTLIIYRALLTDGLIFTEGIHYFRREHSGMISSSNKNSINYRLALIRFKHDIKTYAEKSQISEELKRKLVRYNFFDHFKGLMKEIIIHRINKNLYKEYMARLKKIDKIKYYQSRCYYPLYRATFLLKK